MKNIYSLLLLSYFFLAAECSVGQTISEQANTILLKDSTINMGHIGVSIYEPSTGKYWYNYNATKYFIPASNTKLFSLYAGMKYLGDSIAGLKYQVKDNGEFILYPSGDPTFLHPDFKQQPVFSFLKSISSNVTFISNNWRTNPYGRGWAWDDYNDDYMAERSMMPIYGNVVSFNYIKDKLTASPYLKFDLKYSADYKMGEVPDLFSAKKRSTLLFSIKRKKDKNEFGFIKADKAFEPITIPFITDTSLLKDMLADTLQLQNEQLKFAATDVIPGKNLKVIHTQPVDSVFTPMMHRSDNFFAEQTLLMASNEYLGYMNEGAMIDTILNSTLKTIPQKPVWVDGSGLSRYNLFTPQSFVYILNKMKDEFGMERMKKILPTGGEGTLKNYYKNKTGYIFAKTGTLSNNVALSGYLITKNNKLLIFSIMAGNYPTSATPVRKAVEKFLTYLQEKY